ncbi:MAG: serine/threonine-protein kinase [Elusimicrobiota bacterium]|jgi:hypothetical protein
MFRLAFLLLAGLAQASPPAGSNSLSLIRDSSEPSETASSRTPDAGNAVSPEDKESSEVPLERARTLLPNAPLLSGARVELPQTPQSSHPPSQPPPPRSGFAAAPSDAWQLLDAVAEPRPDAAPWTILALLSLSTLACLGLSRIRRRPVEEPASASPADNDLLAGKYELLRIIGKGAMADVWEAADRSLARRVAVKKITSQQAHPIDEARALASLHHPHILSIYEVLDVPQGLYLVFEFVSGKTLQQLLVEEHRLDLERAKAVLLPVCSALAAAHDRCIVHRDLKPANIMLSDDGNIKVMDFGIALRIGTSQAPAVGTDGVSHPGSRASSFEGTPAYMAPEAQDGCVSPSCDVYSLGVCLYELLSGERPFGQVSLPQKLVRAYPRLSTRVPGLPKDADALIDAVLDPDPRTRMKDVRAFRRVLESIVLETETVRPRP